ncbi:MAG: T9SS type A sorting domain-containing protein [Bacteroidales bacterium]|nr:T9SS type A sorting domain-containing protein [Bacteroidales bacterium]
MYADADFNLYIERVTGEFNSLFNILKSPDKGISWFEVDKLLATEHMKLRNRCQAEVSNTNNVYFGTNYGVFHSVDGGITTQLKNTDLMNSYILDLEADQKNKNNIYAAGNQGLWKSIDGGINWENIICDYINVVKCDPKYPDTIYFGGNSLWRSFDGGDTYQEIVTHLSIKLYDMAINPKETNILYYRDYSCIYKSTDYGDTWATIYFPSIKSSTGDIIIDPNHPDTLYYGKLRSTDGGDTWIEALDKRIIAVHPNNSNILYATGSWQKTLEVSYDWGNSFQIIAEYANGPFSGGHIYCFEIYKENPDYLFYSTRNTNIFYSTDAGTTWQQLEGKYNRRVTDIIPYVNENKYLLSTHGDGVWVYDTTDITAINDRLVKDIDHLKVLPNPFKNFTKITFNIRNSGYTNISIYDLQGNLINTLLNEKKEKGKFEIVWNGKDKNGKDVESGLYLLRLQSGRNIHSCKVVLLN